MSHLPNFFILGAPKSGTTTLYHALEKHPAVHLSTPKEPYYFEDEYEQGTEFYWRTYFAAARTGQPLIGDARRAHLDLPYVPQRIHATVPDARGLRPVSARPYVEAGHYADHLERYLRYFPRSRLCILFHDDLRRSPLETMRRLYEFLGLDPADLRGAWRPGIAKACRRPPGKRR
jgi:hypothetical protein